MSKAQVENLLGSPDGYSGGGIFETWHWDKRTARHQSDLLTVVNFKRGRVVSYEVDVPRDRPMQPVLRPTTPGGNPQRGNPPGQHSPVVDPRGHDPASSGHGAGQSSSGTAIHPSEHGDGSPNPAHEGGGGTSGRLGRLARDGQQGDDAQSCRRTSDCTQGRQCLARTDGAMVCMGNGELGAFCLRDNQCNRGLRCRARSDRLLTCQ
ncbi:MAG: hypothetical protein ABIJ09_16150 [Pseudomonadota bacterium]